MLSSLSREQRSIPLSRSSVENHLGYLDALRGIAILGVILVHAELLTKQHGFVSQVGFTGQRGVQLFYMVSAFTLCLSLDSRKVEHHSLANFFVRRFFHYVAICLNSALNRFAPAYSSLHPLSRWQILTGFFFVDGLSPRTMGLIAIGGWSIAVETSFYVLLPFLHRRFHTVRQTLTLFLVSGLVLGVISRFLSLWAPAYAQQYFAFLWFPVEFPVFVLGLLTYATWTQFIKTQQALDDGQKCGIALLLVFASFMMYWGSLPFNDLQLYFSSFLFFPLILGLSIYLWPFLVNKLTRFFGKISYSVYLLHFHVLIVVGWVLRRIDQYPSHLVSRFIMGRPIGMVIIFLFAAAISVPICVLTWEFIEQPGIRLGRRLIAYREGERALAHTIHLTPPVSELTAPKNTPDAQF